MGRIECRDLTAAPLEIRRFGKVMRPRRSNFEIKGSQKVLDSARAGDIAY
jgi:hypothetical protein